MPSTGNLILRNFEGVSYPVIEITFVNGEHSFKEQFSTDPKSQWIWDSLSKALCIDNKKESISAKEAKGKKLFIVIAGEAVFTKAGIQYNNDGTIFLRKKMRMKFWEYSAIMHPIIQGDPKHNGGVPSGLFLLNEGLDLNQYIQVKDIFDEF